eukprot:Gregarina_sp_Poly_1__124@NODE_1028_length_5298_cov_171_207608_g497_i1_p1_GENE_NODE_1028_length_5298_cov_171_207608_g497_i1NODE_1028_length_5298_cov_171_207608_g497_i1_p1_ORF_typecomplete_len559_score67_88Pkinase/PF00069_25/7_5e44Pkinase_Tyr/PF07714_17/1_5e30Kinaselike/PF14531_6/2_2e03Kinaselike/PF14531_6/1_2e10Kdo/PF06293_14/4_4e08Pkinase_fungal/PF17667_1/2_4e03Pkinase_fungal/PF17667_1/6_5e06WaaY/PF06176_11/1_1e05RIO1/PF01163_22/9_7e06FTA2/PF13095_6/0_0071APH/PF01636_23/0_032APH/PF01636_23/3_3e0
MVVTRSHAQFGYTSTRKTNDMRDESHKRAVGGETPYRASVGSVHSDNLGTTASSASWNHEHEIPPPPHHHHPHARDAETGSTQSGSAGNSNLIVEEEVCFPVPKSIEDIIRGLPSPLPGNVPVTRKRRSVFEDYEIMKEIGSGTYAKVFKLKHRRSKIISAGKFLKPHRFPSNTEKRVVQMFINEIHLLAKTQCPGIVRINAVLWSSDGVLIDLEYVEGGTIWREKVCPSTEARWKHFVQLLQAVEYLHSRGVVHRDLKPTNILQDQHATLKIADFGWAEETGKLQPSTGEWPGTLEINPPEVLNFTGPLTERIDNYAIGMNFLLFVSNRFVCRQKGLNVNVAVPVILKMVENLRKTSHPPVNFTSETWEIFLGLTDPCPSRRWSIQQVYHHPWVVRHYLQYANAEGPDLKGLLWLGAARRLLESYRIPRAIPSSSSPSSMMSGLHSLRSTTAATTPSNKSKSLLHRVFHAPRTIFDWTESASSGTIHNHSLVLPHLKTVGCSTPKSSTKEGSPVNEVMTPSIARLTMPNSSGRTPPIWSTARLPSTTGHLAAVDKAE